MDLARFPDPLASKSGLGNLAREDLDQQDFFIFIFAENLDHFLSNLVLLHHARTVVPGYDAQKKTTLLTEYKANCLRALNSNKNKKLISKVLLKLWIDHGGEGIILDSHGEDYLTMLGRC